MGKVLVGVVVLGVMPQQVLAKTPDAQFVKYLNDVCAVFPAPSGWDTVRKDSLCALGVLTGFASAGGAPAAASSSSVGSANAGGGQANSKKKRIHLDEQSSVSGKGASADGGGWGLLLTPQYGKSNRTDTDLETGYQSSLTGLNVGLDYRYSDSFVLGGMIGQTRDKANFINNTGLRKTSNNTVMLYGTWLPSEKVSIDGYLGYGKISTESQRNIDVFTYIKGAINSSTTGNQKMVGLSTSYQADVGRFNVSPFLNLDFIKTSFKGYSESGSTNWVAQPGGAPDIDYGTRTVALRYFDRSSISFTSSLGARLGTSYGYDWGTLFSSARLASVHEFQNKAQQIKYELVYTPGFGTSVATDAADRNYLISGLGLTAALNGGAQLFFDFEKRSHDRLLSSWAVSLGGLFEF